MMTTKELYKLLSADFKTEKRFSFAHRGEGMMQGRENNTRRVFLINTDTREAWELLTADGSFSFWDMSDVEMATTFDLPYISQRNAMGLRSPYYFGINDYKNGVVSVTWTLQPDGRYYADEDGFGMEDDEEINFTAYIDKSAHVLIPFQQMDESIRGKYRKQAEKIAKNREEIPYICLSPQMTIPLSENKRIENHKKKLLRVIYGIMIQLRAQIESGNISDEDGNIGIFTSINPSPKHYLSLSLIGKKSEADSGKYEVTIVVAIFKEGHESRGAYILMGEYTPSELATAMTNEENAMTIYDEFIQVVKELYA